MSKRAARRRRGRIKGMAHDILAHDILADMPTMSTAVGTTGAPLTVELMQEGARLLRERAEADFIADMVERYYPEHAGHEPLAAVMDPDTLVCWLLCSCTPTRLPLNADRVERDFGRHVVRWKYPHEMMTEREVIQALAADANRLVCGELGRTLGEPAERSDLWAGDREGAVPVGQATDGEPLRKVTEVTGHFRFGDPDLEAAPNVAGWDLDDMVPQVERNARFPWLSVPGRWRITVEFWPESKER